MGAAPFRGRCQKSIFCTGSNAGKALFALYDLQECRLRDERRDHDDRAIAAQARKSGASG